MEHMSAITYCDDTDTSQASNEANHSRKKSSHSRAHALLQADSRSSTSVISSSFAIRNIRDHPGDSLRFIPSCSSDHPVAEKRPKENDESQAEGNKKKWVVKASQVGVEEGQQYDGDVEQGGEKSGPEVQAGRVGELE